MPDYAIGRLLRRLTTLIVLVGAFYFVVSSDAGPTKAFACTSSCRQECVTAYTWCQSHPGDFYQGCNFGRDCDSTTSATICDNQECCSQYRYFCGYEQSPQSGYCWSLNCL